MIKERRKYMNTKKLLSALIAAAVITTSLTACSGDTASQGGSQDDTSASESQVIVTGSVLTADIAADTVIARPTNGAEGIDVTFGDIIKEY